MRKIIGEIAFHLLYYSNVISNPTAFSLEQLAKATDKYRELASRLKAASYTTRTRHLLTTIGPRVKRFTVSFLLMNSSRNKRWLMSTRTVRAIAVLFLLYTGVEITVPQFCSEALGAVSISEPTSDSTNVLVVSSTTHNSQEGLPSEQPSSDEDCFCCCAHVVPGRALATVAVSELMPSFTVPRKTDLPSPVLQGPFHPPRLA